ncbi:unnamed protein product [Prorocentrum cordatum]|uniref:Uncharacterized protein n=1 Tax=Prorocentrum cordatum TaxID=2364126 RepID=A0ABN9UL61_9DINO|nr:unnamed protein product [Polarella glacialis]
MDLNNDPRFFNDNVLDKRLAAFTALSVVSSIMVGAACDNFIPFEEDKLRFDSNMAVFRSCVALVGFFLMCVVFLLNVVATMVFGVQFYYVYRLMTAGQVGCMLVIKMDGDRALQDWVLFVLGAGVIYRVRAVRLQDCPSTRIFVQKDLEVLHWKPGDEEYLAELGGHEGLRLRRCRGGARLWRCRPGLESLADYAGDAPLILSSALCVLEGGPDVATCSSQFLRAGCSVGLSRRSRVKFRARRGCPPRGLRA